MGRRWWC